MKENVIALPVNELKAALTGLGKIIGRRTTLPVLSAVRVSRNDAGIVSLEGTDLDSNAVFPLKEKNEGPAAQLLVPIDRLQKAVKQSNGRVCLFLNRKDEVTIRTFWRDTPIDEKVHVPYIDDFPATPKVEGESICLDNSFRNTLKEAMECASEDESRMVINSVFLDVEDKKGHYLVSTNGRILFSANSFRFDLKESLILPTRKFLGWNGWWTEGDALLSIRTPSKANEPTWIKVMADQWIFTTRGVEGTFPVWKAVLPKHEVNTTIVIPQEAMAGVLEIIARLPGEDCSNHDITLSVARNTFVLHGRNKESSTPVSVPVVEAQVQGKEVAISLDRHYLTKALRFGLNELNIIDELSPLVARNGGKQMVIMPLRPNGPVQVKAQPKLTAPAATSTASTATQAKPAETQTATQPANNERNDMPRQSTVTRVNGEHESQQQDTPLRQLIQQIESIKTSLKNVVNDLNSALEVVKRVEKEKKTNDREMEAIREKVRQIQSVTI